MDKVPGAVSRPRAPGYGIPEHREGLLSWEHVTQRLAAARHYWIDTADRRGHVHATPIWGALVDGILYVEGEPETRRGSTPSCRAKSSPGHSFRPMRPGSRSIRQSRPAWGSAFLP